MLEAPDERFTLSTTIPLVPPLEEPVAAAVAGKLEVMLKDSTHPLEDPPKAQLWGIPTKSQSLLWLEL